MKRVSAVAAGVFVVALAGCDSMPSMPWDSGWTTLIDGTKGMENFNAVGTSNWSATDGSIQADKKSGKENGFLVSKNTYKDFVIRVEFWASDDANSGIFMRCANPKVITDKSCYEANIYDQRPDPSYGTGGIVHHAKIAGSMQKAGGKWNTYEITAKGDHIVVMLNGVKTSELHHKEFANGPIALQHGSGVIKFRKVQIKSL